MAKLKFKINAKNESWDIEIKFQQEQGIGAYSTLKIKDNKDINYSYNLTDILDVKDQAKKIIKITKNLRNYTIDNFKNNDIKYDSLYKNEVFKNLEQAIVCGIEMHFKF